MNTWDSPKLYHRKGVKLVPIPQLFKPKKKPVVIVLKGPKK